MGQLAETKILPENRRGFKKFSGKDQFDNLIAANRFVKLFVMALIISWRTSNGFVMRFLHILLDNC